MILALLIVSAAATSMPQASTRLSPVVVTATRSPTDPLLVPAAIDVISADDMHRAQPAINLTESLQRVPGVVARDRQNQAQDLQISIRGFGARSTFGVRGLRLYSDGIPATMPDGQGQVSHFSLESAERIEVLRGPFSALYGNASGGVIALFSAPAPLRPEFETGMVAGSDGRLRGSLSWRGPLSASGGHGARLDASEVRSDGYRRHSSARRIGGQASFKGGLGANTQYTLLFNALDLEADDPQGLNATELDGDRRAASANSLRFNARKSVRQQQLGARIERQLGTAHRIVLTGHVGDRKAFQMLTVPVAAQASPLSGGGAIDLDRSFHGLDARWQWRTQLFSRPLVLTTGIQHEAAGELRRGYENYVGSVLGVRGALRREENNRVAASDQYLQADWHAGDRWRFNVGARRSLVQFRSLDRFVRPGNPDDSGELAYRNVSPAAGVLFRPASWLGLYANVGRGFETPTFAELAYRSDGGTGLNDSLRPARSRSLELGLRARRGSAEFSAAVFQARTRDELVVVANQGGRSVFANASLSRRRGLELAASKQIAPGWRFAGHYTLLDASYLRDFVVCNVPPCATANRLIRAGRRVPGLPRHAAWAELRWSPTAETDISLQGQFVDRVLVDDANSAGAAAYASLDLGAERRLRAGGFQWRGYARVNNLADRAFIGSVIVNESNGRYFEPAPGRNWVIGLSATRAFK